MPQYSALLEEAVAHAKASGLTGQDQLDLAMYVCDVGVVKVPGLHGARPLWLPVESIRQFSGEGLVFLTVARSHRVVLYDQGQIGRQFWVRNFEERAGSGVHRGGCAVELRRGGKPVPSPTLDCVV